MKQRMLADTTRDRKDSGFVLSYVEDGTNTLVKVESTQQAKCRM